MNYIPTHVQIETVNRFCDARCPMCTIKFVPDFAKDAPDELSNNGQARPAEIMSVETFKTIALKFKPYVDKIRFLSLHGCGEPMLDKTLPEKIKFAKGVFSSAGPISKTRRELEARSGVKSAQVMEAEHSIVHEVNGQKSLYISPGHLMKIKINEKESEEIKNYLIDHVNKDEFIFSYKWDKGDVVVWDNLSIMHKASEIKNCTRIMHRITIK